MLSKRLLSIIYDYFHYLSLRHVDRSSSLEEKLTKIYSKEKVEKIDGLGNSISSFISFEIPRQINISNVLVNLAKLSHLSEIKETFWSSIGHNNSS